MIIGPDIDRQFLAGLDAESSLAVAGREPGKAFFHFMIAKGRFCIVHMDGMVGPDQAGVHLIRNIVGLRGQVVHENAVGQGFLVNDDRLPPTRGIEQLVLVFRAIPAAAVMQIQDKADLRVKDEFLGSPDSGKFRVSFIEPGKFAVHVAMQAARALDDAWKVEIGHDPDRAAIDFIARGQQRGRRKSARLITLDAAEKQGGRRSVSQAEQAEIHGKAGGTGCGTRK